MTALRDVSMRPRMKEPAMKIGWFAASVMVVGSMMLGSFGCGPDRQRADREAAAREVPIQQRYSLDMVRLRAEDLRPGMSRSEVYLLLGAPAEYGDRVWVYRGGVDGGQELRVHFDGDRYVGHGSK
jgi:hypothetical protein